MRGKLIVTTALFGILTVSLAVIVTLIIYTIAVLDFPYNGGLRVGPETFELVLRRIEGD